MADVDRTAETTNHQSPRVDKPEITESVLSEIHQSLSPSIDGLKKLRSEYTRCLAEDPVHCNEFFPATLDVLRKKNYGPQYEWLLEKYQSSTFADEIAKTNGVKLGSIYGAEPVTPVAGKDQFDQFMARANLNDFYSLISPKIHMSEIEEYVNDFNQNLTDQLRAKTAQSQIHQPAQALERVYKPLNPFAGPFYDLNPLNKLKPWNYTYR